MQDGRQKRKRPSQERALSLADAKQGAGRNTPYHFDKKGYKNSVIAAHPSPIKQVRHSWCYLDRVLK